MRIRLWLRLAALVALSALLPSCPPASPHEVAPQAPQAAASALALVPAPSTPPAPTPCRPQRPAPALVDSWWTHRIDAIVGAHKVGVAVGIDGHLMYGHKVNLARIPASNQKLIL